MFRRTSTGLALWLSAAVAATPAEAAPQSPAPSAEAKSTAPEAKSPTPEAKPATAPETAATKAAPATASKGADAAGTEAPKPAAAAAKPTAAAAKPAAAAAKPKPDKAPAQPAGFTPSLVLDRGRFAPTRPIKDAVRFSMHGEYQLRFRANTSLPLSQPIGAAAGASDTLGQRYYLYHWLRLRPQLLYSDQLRLVAEVDFPRGLIVGETTELVDAARDDYRRVRFWDIHPRQLYFEYRAPVGVFRLGQQTSHWGMGLLANDGDHPSLFGDYRRGVLVERFLFATKPMGADEPLQLALAGDVVFEDELADLIDGDIALQAVAAVRWQTPAYELGLYGIFRHQFTEQEPVALAAFREELTVGVVDVAGKFQVPLPGHPDTFVFGEAEAAAIFGSTTYLRTAQQLTGGQRERIRSFGSAVRLGAIHSAHDKDGRFGQLVGSLEWGYASGDADPYDGTTARFTFHQDHNVGLVLFDHVLAWRTARAATLARDPAIVNRPAPGLRFLPSEGGIFGATYLYPTLVVRPLRQLDLKAGAVIATSTADVVDPYRAGALGDYANFDGGDARKHNLGLELDLGIDGRIDLGKAARLQLGAEGGVLFPGNAFDDANSNRMRTQWLLNTRVGLQI